MTWLADFIYNGKLVMAMKYLTYISSSFIQVGIVKCS